jgi:hypothetical protein
MLMTNVQNASKASKESIQTQDVAIVQKVLDGAQLASMIAFQK